MFVLGKTILSLDRPFVVKGIQYPANWLRLSSLEEKRAIGIREEPDPAIWDERFYWGYDDAGRLLPKDHAQLIEQWTKTTNECAGKFLAASDWKVIRQLDSGVAIDAKTKQWREAIRVEASAKTAAIKATKTTDDLAAYVTSEKYTSWPALD
jgi:hypothetical protein